MTQTLLTLICLPSLERTVIDWLLEQENIAGFTSSFVHGHGSDPTKLTLLEQVQGSKEQVEFQIHMDSKKAEIVIDALKTDLKNANVHYWLVPVIEAGRT